VFLGVLATKASPPLYLQGQKENYADFMKNVATNALTSRRKRLLGGLGAKKKVGLAPNAAGRN
jgi:hypothetical protein